MKQFSNVFALIAALMLSGSAFAGDASVSVDFSFTLSDQSKGGRQALVSGINKVLVKGSEIAGTRFDAICRFSISELAPQGRAGDVYAFANAVCSPVFPENSRLDDNALALYLESELSKELGIQLTVPRMSHFPGGTVHNAPISR
jgi:hypothetical protein